MSKGKWEVLCNKCGYIFGGITDEAIKGIHKCQCGTVLEKYKLGEFQSALQDQISGTHYKKLKIQPVEYCHANKIPFLEGCIIKYVTRWKDKGGIEDLKKAKHFIDILIELETREDEPVKT